MTATTTNSTEIPVLHTLLSPFRAVGRFLIQCANNNHRLMTAQKLNAMSDAELAKLGITRDKIVQYAFRDVYYL
ncbi:hypothetical protein I5535_06015 [Rhodobacteraceae bacterium F11138]|nr:hypothetical protein [Rhodobacteraceae bacterium F11138]